jgi:hypothetical protein
MNEQSSLSEYLVLSRGQWDKGASKEDIEAAINKFYEWYERNLKAGRNEDGITTQHGGRDGFQIRHRH